MTKHLKRDLDTIERSILKVGALVEQSIMKAITVIKSGDVALTREIVEEDKVIDRLEVELEESCLKALALHQPVAVDLRFIVAVIKVNSTLERMGDHACNIARGTQGTGLALLSQPEAEADVNKMAEMVRKMVKDSLNALVNLDVQLARQVLNSDDEVDDQHYHIREEIIEHIEKDASHARDDLKLILATRHLERIADLATNIAEDVIFMVEGEIIRHQGA